MKTYKCKECGQEIKSPVPPKRPCKCGTRGKWKLPKSNRKIPLLTEKILLKSAKAWNLSHCEPTTGWPGQWTVVWRAPDFFGKIGKFVVSKKRPNKEQLKLELEALLLERFQSPLRCDAKRVAYSYLEKKGELLELPKSLDIGKLLSDQINDLDARIAGEFFSSDAPRLFTASSHGWMLGEIAEIRCLVSALKNQIDEW